ncbi:uncharacterized protein LOC133188503 [Saccostrea echinata]|uniref:uncharacterized protein LOC133188503 n=1 Tax=Saccostrea echinata TaxID=191078 RepID=UPI002A7ECB81|nr:uncharacterized protein LOC133188503 [Saccostrea echinata]
MMTTSITASVLLVMALIIAAKIIDDSLFYKYLIGTHDQVRGRFISITSFLPRVELIDGTATYTVLCFLALLSLALFWIVCFLLVKILVYPWIAINKAVEFIVSMAVYLFSSMSNAVLIQIIKFAIVPVTAIILYFTWDKILPYFHKT